ncbi:MAG TPA: ribonuclease P protein component [Dongiaceae bacterium]|nr:ribonuclease P protein component [Dongiaceae bacterium]
MIGRLKRRAEFLQVAAANRKWVAPGLILQVCRHSRSETVNATRKGGADVLRARDGRPDAPSAPAAPAPSAETQSLPSSAHLSPAQPSPIESAAAAPMRVGFTASRKVGNAVLRNRAKRRLRAAVDIVVAGHGAPGHDIVLIARQATVSRDFAALLQDLTTGLKKMGAYQPDRQT